MSNETKIGEANAGFEACKPAPKRFDFDLKTVLAFEAGVEHAEAKTEAERAALKALVAWREAEKAAEEANYAWTEGPTPEADRRLEAAFRMKSERLLALRAAADSLMGTEGE